MTDQRPVADLKKDVILPNAIIAGAPKCGTSSLFDYLAAHPEVCPSSVKETRYLIDPGYPLYRKECNYSGQGLDGYGAFFPACANDTHRVIMEATPDYLYQKTPLTVLPFWGETLQVFFILRKPSERIYSLFRFAQHNMAVLDMRYTFTQFVDMVMTRDKRIADRVILANAVEHSKYERYLRHWYAALNPKQIHVMRFEDMVTAPRAFMRRVSRCLKIEAEFYGGYDFLRKNPTVSIRSQWLHRLKRRQAFLAAALGSLPFAHSLYRRLNVKEAATEKTMQDRETLAALDQFFESHNELLRHLTGTPI